MTAIFFAYSASGGARRTFEAWQWLKLPLHILVAYPFLAAWTANQRRHGGAPYSTILDSGAFSAWQSGKKVDIDALIEEAKRGPWDECVALDVIGDSVGSVRNALYMKERGAPVIPVFHYGEPWGVLHDYCQVFPRVGLSCQFGEPRSKSIAWVEQCFAREWPHLFHSFGWVSERILTRVPFDTADAASWTNGPQVFGRWQSYGANLRVRKIGTDPDLSKRVLLDAEIHFYLALQRRLEEQWGDQLHSMRLATLGESLTRRRRLWTSSPGKAVPSP